MNILSLNNFEFDLSTGSSVSKNSAGYPISITTGNNKTNFTYVTDTDDENFIKGMTVTTSRATDNTIINTTTYTLNYDTNSEGVKTFTSFDIADTQHQTSGDVVNNYSL